MSLGPSFTSPSDQALEAIGAAKRTSGVCAIEDLRVIGEATRLIMEQALEMVGGDPEVWVDQVLAHIEVDGVMTASQMVRMATYAKALAKSGILISDQELIERSFDNNLEWPTYGY